KPRRRASGSARAPLARASGVLGRGGALARGPLVRGLDAVPVERGLGGGAVALALERVPNGPGPTGRGGPALAAGSGRVLRRAPRLRRCLAGLGRRERDARPAGLRQ